ncbi:MAG: metallophosphoesterase [Clostridia bacterium]|nr:metallophosphoesterase [Clostridia bacterium]
MNPTLTRIPIGLDAPFRALHLSDSHLSLADDRDDERKNILAQRRQKEFDSAGKGIMFHITEQLAYAKEHNLPILYTGDMIDFVSHKNLETAQALLKDADYFMAVGNHEFSLYVGEAFEDEAYKMQSYDFVQKHFKDDLTFASREMGGINFVAADNSYYRFTENQLEKLKREAEKGFPIVLMLHCPLHTDELYHLIMDDLHFPCAYLAGTPENLLKSYDDYRYRQQKPDEETEAFIDYVYSCPKIKAVLAGHMHENAESRLPSGIMQYITGGGYKGHAREIEFL